MIKNITKSNKKGMGFIFSPPIAIAILLAIVGVVILSANALSDNGNGLKNLYYQDVSSGTDIVQGCEPKKYIIVFDGTLDLINQKTSTWAITDYKIDYIDTHISNIRLDKLGIISNEFTSELCLYDVLAGGDEWNKHEIECIKIDGKITKGQIEKYPFEFKYNLYDNDCNGEVDDHTFNLVAELNQQSESPEYFEKTVAIVNGKPVFQNVKY